MEGEWDEIAIVEQTAEEIASVFYLFEDRKASVFDVFNKRKHR